MARSKLNSGGTSEQEMPKAKINKQTLAQTKRFLEYLKPYQLKFGIGMLMLVAGSLLSLGFPYFMGKLIDAATGKATDPVLQNINFVAGALMLILIVQATISFFRIYFFVQVGEKSLADLRVATYKHIVQLPMAFYANSRVGDLQSRMSADLAQIQDTLTTTLAELIRQVVVLTGGIILLSVTSGKLTLFMLAILPVLIIIAVVFGKYIRKVAKNAQDKLAETNVVVEESLQAIQSVKAFTNEKYEVNRYAHKMQEVVTFALKGAKLRGGFASFIIFCLFGCIVAVIWYGAGMVQAGLLTIGSLTSFVLYSTFVGAAMGSFAELYAQVQKALGATERIFQLMDEKAEEIAFTDAPNGVKIAGHLTLDSVGFAYPSRPEVEVLNNISFDVPQGGKIALIGTSGAGKSTIAGLLLRFYEPNQGQIRIDQTPIQQLPLTTLRQQIAIVPQDVTLFGGTIFENIAYGKPNATTAEVVAAAEKAYAMQFIQDFPEGLQTVVGERGIKLSGGQRQRIAIARAILKNPSILILDEATSALDSESERWVQKALDELMQNRTSIIIAHRLSTIRNADQIVVIDKGIVVEKGTHEALMNLDDGVYKSLKLLQGDMVAS